jgi:hypothetical protein
MSVPRQPQPSRGGALISLVGRSLTVVLFMILGLIGGMVGGGYRAAAQVAAIVPPAKATMGMETAGFEPIIIWIVDLLIWGVGGALLGLVAGLLWAIFWPRTAAAD